eukprot:2885446-Prymnesium_polylepis.1
MDDGATCNIRTTAQGCVPNTWRKPAGPLSIGDSGAKLESKGSHLYAETRVGSYGVEDPYRCTAGPR